MYMYVCITCNNWCITVVVTYSYTALLPLIEQLTVAREASTEMITNTIVYMKMLNLYNYINMQL